jgi:hypothetical protein
VRGRTASSLILTWKGERFGPADAEDSLGDGFGPVFAEFRAVLSERILSRFLASSPSPSRPDLGKFRATVGDIAALVVEVGVVAAAEYLVERLSREAGVPKESARARLDAAVLKIEERSLDEQASMPGMEDWLVAKIAGHKASLRRVHRRKSSLGLPVGGDGDADAGDDDADEERRPRAAQDFYWNSSKNQKYSFGMITCLHSEGRSAW